MPGPCVRRDARAARRLGSELGRVTSGVDGSYQIAAAPGAYVLDPQPLDGRPLPHAGPIDVAVEAGAWTTVDVAYDSGIR